MPSRLESPDESSLRRAVEHLDARADATIRRATGSARANPLLHAGTISVFLLGVVTLSGIYITLFFEYGHVASYEAVADIDDHPVQGVVRSIHRYSSAALVVTTLVHAWRIFVAGRFTAGRRFRWLTGVFALGIVWLAGVTGYALVGDQRTQAIGGAVAHLIDWSGWGARRVSTTMIDAAAGEGGSGLYLLIWFAHLLLTAVIGWAMWRHLRRSRQPIVPPRHWMAVAMVGLVAVSIVVPADLLDRADPARVVPDMTLDPFILFLLPPLRSDAAIWVMLAMIAGGVLSAAVPWLLRDRPPTVIEIDEAACTGCDLCVVDCPYLALRLEEDADGRPVARLDADACVACGICIGSCSFGAITMDGHPAAATIVADGRDVVLTCRRQGRHRSVPDDDGAVDGRVAVVVECTGALHAGVAGELTRLGATSVEIAGCGPGECAYGVGNQLTHERLDGTRRPHAARRDQGLAVETYVELGAHTPLPGASPDPDASELPGSLRGRTVGAALAIGSLVVIGLATLLPFAGDGDEATVRIVAAHRIGDQIEGQPDPDGDTSGPVSVEIAVDAATETLAVSPADGRVDQILDLAVEPGRHDITVTWVEGDVRAVLFDDTVAVAAGSRVLVPVTDTPPPLGVREGREVFTDSRAGGCTICHSTDRGVEDVGPSLYGVADRAGEAVPGLDAEAYLRQSILDPDAFVVDGWPAGQMLPIYGERLTPEQLDALVQYLLTLEDR